VPIWTTQPPRPIIPKGAIGIVSQSGATAGFIAAFAQRQGIGLSYQVSTGNEADVNVARVLDFLVDDPGHRPVPRDRARRGPARRRGAAGAGG
jgi:acyl-CoA synthetase (NDP forming)